VTCLSTFRRYPDAMSDERWNQHVPVPATTYSPGEPLWQTRANHVTRSAKLKDRGRSGIEAPTFHNAEFVISGGGWPT